MKNLTYQETMELNQLVGDLRTKIIDARDRDLSHKAFEDSNYRKPRKTVIRAIHRSNREESVRKIQKAIGDRKIREYLGAYFAKGSDVIPENIEPDLRLVKGTNYTELFRLITTVWSVPPTVGYGRKMRWLIFDNSNEKIIGALALGDAPIGLKERDDWIGWNKIQKETKIKEIMNAYVVGAVQPYSMLLGGKLIASIMASQEVSNVVYERYANRKTMHGERVNRESMHTGKLAAITVTSALGRSSIYNRVKLPGLLELVQIGSTKGHGNFQFGDETYKSMHRLLQLKGNSVVEKYQYGDGPNYRMRLIQGALRELDLSADLLRHNIYREIYGMPLAANFKNYLQGKDEVMESNLASLEDISQAAIRRWVIPRAERFPTYKYWDEDDTYQSFRDLME